MKGVQFLVDDQGRGGAYPRSSKVGKPEARKAPVRLQGLVSA